MAPVASSYSLMMTAWWMKQVRITHIHRKSAVKIIPPQESMPLAAFNIAYLPTMS